RPYDATATVIDALPKPKDPELDVDIQRCVLVGEKEGNPMTLRYEAVTWPHKKWNVGGGVVDTAVPPSIAAQWMVNGVIPQRVVMGRPAVSLTVGAAYTYHTNLAKIDPGVLTEGSSDTPSATSTGGSVPNAASPTIAVIKPTDVASTPWASSGYDFVVDSLEAV